ncbi:Shedu immune nuclease family protein [Melissospora conviva]|uniref:Shedu immune nuclease family protein n=1 Tax=Melissospora conviva TaxID=3388432 RepID=UPI003C20C280
MAEFGSGTLDRGFLTLEKESPELTKVLFHASSQTLRELRWSEGERRDPVQILQFDAENSRVHIYPIGTQPTEDLFALPKYATLRVISVPLDYFETPSSVEEVTALLDDLPRGFLKDYQFGLGLAKAYRPIVLAIEKIPGCRELHLATEGPARIESGRLIVSLSDFEAARTEADRISSRANKAAMNVKMASAGNWLSRLLGHPEQPYKRGHHPMVRAFADAAANDQPLESEEIEGIGEIIRRQSKHVSAKQPEALAKLRNDIELVELDGLLTRFKRMLASTSHTEAIWQDFFVQNPFILSFAFSYPMILVQDQAVAGGRKISGSGEKIADFLSKNPATNNVAIIEIKKPNTPLIQQKEYRGGVYGPSSELTSSITQVLDQRYQLITEFATLQKSSRMYDIESFAVQLCLIIGRAPSDPDQAKSLELFRSTLSAIEVITFDELLERMRLLRSFLGSSERDDTPKQTNPKGANRPIA